MNIEPLEEAGLTKGEIKVYLALLECGSTTTGPVVEKSGVAKSIVYQLLEKLIQKGLVSVVLQQKTKHFQASDPQKLLEYIEERETLLQKNKERVEKLIPELLLKQAQATASETHMYFGFRGMITAHEHLYERLERGDEYVYLGVPSFQPHAHELYWQRDHERRAAKGIRCKLLFNSDIDACVLKQRNRYNGAQARRMGQEIVTPAMIGIFKDTVTITVQHPEVICVEIIHPQVADSFMSYFNHFWERSLR